MAATRITGDMVRQTMAETGASADGTAPYGSPRDTLYAIWFGLILSLPLCAIIGFVLFALNSF